MNGNRLYKNTHFQTDARRSERLYAAVEQFEYSPELAKRVYFLGMPHFTDSISTASLTVTGRGKPIFDFNRTFFDDLGYIALVFVILHETLHYAFRQGIPDPLLRGQGVGQSTLLALRALLVSESETVFPLPGFSGKGVAPHRG